MSAPEFPAATEAQQILELQRQILVKQQNTADALNGLGQNLQWMIDQAKGIFQMLGNPSMMANLAPMMSGVLSNGGNAADPAGPEGADSGAASGGSVLDEVREQA